MLAALGPWALGRPLRQTSEQDFTEDDGTWTYTYTIHAASDCSDAASATLDQFTNPDGTTLFGHCAYRSDPFADPSPLVATNSSMICAPPPGPCAPHPAPTSPRCCLQTSARRSPRTRTPW